MISEARFAKSFTSSWRSLTPTLELFVRKANLRLTERDWVPLKSNSSPSDRALINMISFEALQVSQNQADILDKEGWIISDDNLRQCEFSLSGKNDLERDGIREAGQLARRMMINLLVSQTGNVTLSPRYAGCGIINSCIGDAITDNLRVIELKDGDRPFRSYEFRQLVIYAALLLNSGGGLANEIQVINSRRGTSVTIALEDFAREVAGQSAIDLLSEVIRFLSDGIVYQG